MEREQSETLPPELREWVEQRAEERDTDSAAVLASAVTIYRALDAEAEDSNETHLDALDSELESLDERISAVETDVDDKIEDIRDRIVQIKREADAKAPSDHDHPALEDRLDAAAHAANDAETAVETLSKRLDSGFENYEEILEYLTDQTDTLDEKTNALASAIVDVRSEIQRISAAEHDRQAVDDLQTAANRHGERTAACGDCGATVDLGLLSRPRCPHCEATFVDFEPASGFFSSATLTTGDHLALEGGDIDVPDRPTDLFDTGGPSDG